MSLTVLLMLVGTNPPSEFRFELPTSYRREVVQRCAPATLEAAETCLRNAMSAEDFAILSDRISARRFRGAIDCEIETAWRLPDPQSAMGREMDRLLGDHLPGIAASMIISDIQQRARSGHGLDLASFYGRLRASASPDGPNTTCTITETPPTNEARHAH
jgi:hypothetical protein